MHGGCDSSTGDAYSSFAPDPTTGTSRGPRFPNSIFCVADRSYEVDHCLLLLTGNTQNAVARALNVRQSTISVYTP